MINTELQEVFKFLEHVEQHQLLNRNTILSRKTACRILFETLSKDEQSIDFILFNLDQLFKKVSVTDAQTLDVYKSRVKATLENFKAWKLDRSQWEASAQLGMNRKINLYKIRDQYQLHLPANSIGKSSLAERIKYQTIATRHVSLSIRENFEVSVTIPKNGLTRQEFYRLTYLLMPHCPEFSIEDIAATGQMFIDRQSDKSNSVSSQVINPSTNL